MISPRLGLVGCVSACCCALALPAITGASSAPAGGTFPGAPRSQRFAFGSTCPAAPANRYLTTRGGCLSVRLGDVDGDGKPDLVLLYTKPGVRSPAYRFTLKVFRSEGGTATARLPEGDIPATIAALRNVNGVPGAELFIHLEHITTSETMALYTFSGGRLRRAGELSYGGSDFGIRFGFTCRLGPPPTVVQDEFSLTHGPGTWSHTSTTYTWSGAALAKGSAHTTTFHGKRAPRSLVGVHC
jgi:hypothetical protein